MVTVPTGLYILLVTVRPWFLPTAQPGLSGSSSSASRWGHCVHIYSGAPFDIQRFLSSFGNPLIVDPFLTFEQGLFELLFTKYKYGVLTLTNCLFNNCVAGETKS